MAALLQQRGGQVQSTPVTICRIENHGEEIRTGNSGKHNQVQGPGQSTKQKLYDASPNAADDNLGQYNGKQHIQLRKCDKFKHFVRAKGPRIMASAATIGMFVFNVVSVAC
ncbi:hypothetical protein Slin15195_G113810 [Septoria linicola]|uniref:Uncharacterized protein n=1 Tax=Septoria linicola TaxID=215465 RepID=A0A9Q9B646_9PEZI|nr:hypothetical protein Slin14017_G112140 [Septoria linicola]USW58062.1 hypothetical protein Slin15195_G113810 [Septoria linicola]